MNAIFLVGAQLAVIVAGVLILALLLKRRLPGRWTWWWAGALSFVASQVLRIPMIAAVAAGASALYGPGAVTVTTILLVFQLLTSGLFEESARYAVMRWLAKSVRAWRPAVMFGAGHGSVEAVIVFVFGLVNVAVLTLGGDALVAQTQALSAQQADILRAQIQALQTQPVWTYGLGVYERILAITLHIALSMLVMRSARGDGLRWLFIAMAVHILVNTVVVLCAQRWGPVAAEGVMTVIAAGCGWLIAFLRRHDFVAPPAPVQLRST